MKTLLNTYCSIDTEEHVKELAEHQRWVSERYIGDAVAMGEIFDDYYFGAFDPEDLPHRTRVTVEQYIDLLTDRITSWRLEEVGFSLDDFFAGEYNLNIGDAQIAIQPEYVEIWGKEKDELIRAWGINTFSELLILIKFITPKP